MYNVVGIQFGLLSDAEKSRIADIDVSNSGIKSNSNALYDPRLGSVESGSSCFECKLRELECSGHWSKVEFPTYFPHPYYFDEIKMILQCVCIKCSNLLYGEKKILLNNLDEYSGLQRLKCIYKNVLAMCENAQCTNCNNLIYKIVNIDSKFKVEFYNFTKCKTEKVEIKYEKIVEIFKNISTHDFNTLGFNSNLRKDSKYGVPIRVMTSHRHEMRPEDYFMSNMLIVPPCIRPQNIDNSHDDITIGSSAIIKKIKSINTAKNETIRNKLIDALQSEVYSYMSQNPETAMGGKRIIMNICQRVKGKDGQFRTYIESTRSDYGGRTVIGPDPSLKVYEIGIPQAMTRITQTVRVANFNIAHWNKILKRDRNKSLETPPSGKLYSTTRTVKFEPTIQYICRNGKKFNSNAKFISTLNVGDVLDVRLQDGMEVLFNRNPTIREESINAHIVKVHKDPHKKTVTINPAVCTAYGADFDGDEGNISVPQGDSARAEMNVQINIRNKINSTQCGYNIITLIQDIIIGMYYITMDDMTVERDVFFDLCMSINFTNISEFMNRARKFYKIPKKYTSLPGRVAASILFDKLFCYRKGNLEITNGIIISGTFDKSTLGSSKNSIIHKISIEYSTETASDFVTNCTWFANQWNLHHGFTFGIMDCVSTQKHLVKVQIDRASAKIDYIHSTNSTDAEKEALIIESLMNVNSIGQKIAKDGMIGGAKNAMSVATLSGARGNFDNLMAISCTVGLQTVGGKRMEPMICEGTRVLPCFARHDQRLAANSFIMHNYLNGLSPVESFYTAWATRDGIINTAITTSQSGYGHRRFEKKMENCKTYNDCTIRDCNGKIVDFCYGEYNYSGTMVYFVDDIPFCCDPVSICKMCNMEYEGPENPKMYTLADSQIDHIFKKLYYRGVDTNASRSLRDRTCQFLKRKLQECKIIAEPKIVKNFINKIIAYHNRAIVNVGEMVGGKASNAMGEDSTQGALSSFHDTGRSTKTVVTGLPRLIEIINLTTELTTTSMSFLTRIPPDVTTEVQRFKYVYSLRKYFEYRVLSQISTCTIENINSSTNKYERLLQLHVEHDIPKWVELYCNMYKITPPEMNGFVIVYNIDSLQMYKYGLTLHDIVKLLQSDEYVAIPSPPKLCKILIYPNYESIPKKYNKVGGKSWMYYYTRDYLQKIISNTVITGISGITTIYYAGVVDNCIKIDVQGNNFSELANHKLVIFPTLESDVIYEIYNNLGIAATYTFLYNELCKVFSKPILPCNIMLLARTMTRDGIPTNVSRHGINDDVGIVTKMMNETVMEIITNGASVGSSDTNNSVASSYVLGNLGQYGTFDNSFELLLKK